VEHVGTSGCGIIAEAWKKILRERSAWCVLVLALTMSDLRSPKAQARGEPAYSYAYNPLLGVFHDGVPLV
jgi:hypothetical protein